MTVRWTFEEVATGETYTVPINPDSMTSPTNERSFKHAFGLAEGVPRARTVETATPARDWEFAGAVRTRAHYDDLCTWVKKPGKVQITDHLGRVFEVMFTGIEPVERTPTRSTPWRLRYTIKALLLRRIA